MIIHTQHILEKSKLNYLEEKENLNEVLKIKDKILIHLEKRIKNTKEIEKELSLKGRTTRRSLFDLEKEGKVKRIRGKIMNRKKGESDSWKLINKGKLTKKIPKNKICIFYETYHKNNIHKKHYYLVPKKLDINKNRLTSLGFFQAEGSKKIKSVEIVNSEPRLIEQFLKFLKYFKINKKNLRFKQKNINKNKD